MGDPSATAGVNPGGGGVVLQISSDWGDQRIFLACEQALQGALAAGQEREGELATMSTTTITKQRQQRTFNLVFNNGVNNVTDV